MDFDKFIEKDIIEFLDNQAMLVAEKAAGLREEEFDLYEITKDYSKEITEALRNEDLKKAREIFEDVKNRYQKAPDNSLSKKRLYTIMEEIYERIKDYEGKEEGKKSLFETIKEYEEKGLFATPAIDAEGKEVSGINLVLSAIAEKEKELERVTVKKPFKNEDLQKAVNIYRELKELAQRIPDSSPQEKEKIYDATLSWYYIIKKLKEKLASEEQAQAAIIAKKDIKPEQKKSVEQILEEVRILKGEIIKSHMQIADYIKKRELNRSIEEYNHLKKLCEQFPQEMSEEKTALLADALSLYESINKLKKSLSQQGLVEESASEESWKEKENRERIKSEIKSKLETIKNLFQQKNVAGAISEYNKLRALFNTYPEQPADEKKQLYEEIMHAHKNIKMLEDDLKKKAPAQSKDKIADIKKILEETNSLLDKGKSEEATHNLLEAKHRTQLLPKEEFDEKYNLVKEIEKLEHKLTFVKNVRKIVPPTPVVEKD